MIFTYYLHKFNPVDLNYIYLVKVNNDILEIDINLHNYSNYIFIKNENTVYEKYYKAIKIYKYSKNFNKYSNLGDIKKINVTDYIKNRCNTKKIINSGILYTPCNQTEFDKYYYLNNIKNDNSRLFNYIYKKIISFYKDEYIKRVKTIKKNIKILNIYNKLYKESIV